MERKENSVLLRGTAAEAPVLSHRSRGLDFYRFPLEVPRLSGQVDRLNILVPSGIFLPKEGDYVEVAGEIRSFNNRSGVGSRLVITVLARTVSPGFGEPCNLVRLRGRLCRPPVRRRTPLGRDICDLLLAVDRRYRRADYIPRLPWGAPSYRCGGLEPGAPLWLEGRLQSRVYRKVLGEEVQERTAFEVSISALDEPAEEAEAPSADEETNMVF